MYNFYLIFEHFRQFSTICGLVHSGSRPFNYTQWGRSSSCMESDGLGVNPTSSGIIGVVQAGNYAACNATCVRTRTHPHVVRDRYAMLG